MSIGSSQLPAPAEPPEIHDIGIMSASDDQETVNAAVGLEPKKPTKEPPAGEETPPEETPPEETPPEETPPEETPAERPAVQKREASQTQRSCP